MGNSARPWIQTRGLGRLLAQETTLSDVIQLLSDRDLSPWEGVLGFLPDDVKREASEANKADLLAISGEHLAVVEVKLGHVMSFKQQAAYESVTPQPALYLAALAADRHRVERDAPAWTFLSLGDLVRRWADSDDTFARLLAIETATIIEAWDDSVQAVFEARDSRTRRPLQTLNQKLVARVVTRRIAKDLIARDRLATAGVTAGGGLPLIQSWVPIRGEAQDRAFIAEVRWWETRPGGELRFGVDFDPRPDKTEDEEVRRAAFDLATSMSEWLEYASLRDHLAAERPELASLLRRTRSSRPASRGDWEHVIVHGFEHKNNRNQTRPEFYGDGTMRFQAIAEVDFGEASAADLTDLLDCTLRYLASQQPTGTSA